MEKNFENLSAQEIMRLANTETGKALIALFQQQRSDQVQSVMKSLRSGDLERAKNALSDFMMDPKTQQLLAQMEQKHE